MLRTGRQAGSADCGKAREGEPLSIQSNTKLHDVHEGHTGTKVRCTSRCGKVQNFNILR